ncbi:hypothetical protein LK459_17590 [Gordonia otitidis]|uniref:hypothetical protein n=1 Tax=Gordonia otitidis TaxID=249058 RepID=UPI001D138534|nr:hypothetical protein [Gordonia otitidis]UEA58376.1 hypothetical protein LK459_17590 [Gordonia otitidis]
MAETSEIETVQAIGGWIAEVHWLADDIQAGPTSVVVRPSEAGKTPAGGVSSTILRQIDFRTAAAQAREISSARADDTEHEDKPPQVAMPLLKSILDSGGVTRLYLTLLATEYLARVERGQPKPVDHIAEELDRSLGTVKNHLWKARHEGILEGGSAGRKGGYVPTDVAEDAVNTLDEFFSGLDTHE